MLDSVAYPILIIEYDWGITVHNIRKHFCLGDVRYVMATILVADDAELSRGSISAVLECFGYEVIEANNSDKCLAALDDSPCDLLITDIDMPQINGIEVILELKKKFPNFPVIAISGHDRLFSIEPLNLAVTAGANATLNKPFKAEELLSSVKNLLAGTT